MAYNAKKSLNAYICQLALNLLAVKVANTTQLLTIAKAFSLVYYCAKFLVKANCFTSFYALTIQ